MMTSHVTAGDIISLRVQQIGDTPCRQRLDLIAVIEKFLKMGEPLTKPCLPLSTICTAGDDKWKK